MRKPGYYWAKSKEGKNYIIYHSINGVCLIPGESERLFASDFYHIDDEPIEEPKQELIPGKYYIVKSHGNVVTTKIAKLHNNGDFIFLGCHNSADPCNYDVLSEGFDIEDIMKHFKTT